MNKSILEIQERLGFILEEAVCLATPDKGHVLFSINRAVQIGAKKFLILVEAQIKEDSRRKVAVKVLHFGEKGRIIIEGVEGGKVHFYSDDGFDDIKYKKAEKSFERVCEKFFKSAENSLQLLG